MSKELEQGSNPQKRTWLTALRLYAWDERAGAVTILMKRYMPHLYTPFALANNVAGPIGVVADDWVIVLVIIGAVRGVIKYRDPNYPYDKKRNK